MAKLLKHFGWGVKKSNNQISSSRTECNNSTQKSNSVHELTSKSPNRYQSNVCLTSGNAAIGSGNGSNSGTAVAACSISSTRSEYDTRSLKLNLDGTKQFNDKNHYQSLQKGVGSSSSSRASKGKCDGLVSPGSGSNVGSIDTPEGASSSDSANLPMIVDEYCDPLDLAETSSLLVDDDYSIPYDEVNKVLKDIQTNKADRLLNGISNNIIPVDKVGSTDGEHLAKVPLKLTSSSQVTSLRIKARRPKEHKEPSEEQDTIAPKSDKQEEIKTDGRNGNEDGEGVASKVPSTNEISVLPENNLVPPASANQIASSEILDEAGHLYSNNSTSGGSVTVMSVNNFNDFEPIDFGHMLSSLSVNRKKDSSNSESKGNDFLPQPITSDQSHPVKGDPNSEVEHHDNLGKDLLRPHNSSKTRPKSDGILLFSPKGSKKLRHKHVQNGSNNDGKDNGKHDCHNEDQNNHCFTIAKNHHGNKTFLKESKSRDISAPSKSIVKMSLSLPLHQQCWFHGRMGRMDAEKLLGGREEGTFLVRISESNNEDFSLSLKSSNGFLHIKIVQQALEDGIRKFILGQFSQPFDSVASMVRFYRENKLPVKGSESLFLASPLTAGTS